MISHIAAGAEDGLVIGLVLWVGIMILGLTIDTVFDNGNPAVTLKIAFRMLAILAGGGTLVGTLLSILPGGRP
jgi:hypothetical protein